MFLTLFYDYLVVVVVTAFVIIFIRTEKRIKIFESRRKDCPQALTSTTKYK